MKRVTAVNLADWALAQGRTALATREIAQILEIPADQVRRRLAAPSGRGEWVSIARGVWLPVPAELRGTGKIYALDAIGPVMRKLGLNYYVGWLSAAALHGATHQAVQVFQVAVDRPAHPTGANQLRIQYFVRSELQNVTTVNKVSRTDVVPVSSVEATMLDIASDVSSCGGLGNAATIIAELAELDDFSVERLIRQATFFSATAIRRLGWILGQLQPSLNLSGLLKIAESMSHTPARLNPHYPAKGPLDKTWNIYMNSEFEPEA